jgi:sulfite exporter TauE/SafE
MMDLAGSAMGLQRLAAYAVGVSLLIWGTVLAFRAAGLSIPLIASPGFVGRFVQAGFRSVKHWPRSLHAAAIGLLSGFLPCGWLYLFVLAAAGTENARQGGSVMLAFWIGTLPILTAVTAGASKLSVRHHKVLPAATAIICLLAGGHTLWARARSDFDNLRVPASIRTSHDLSNLSHQPLPCCRHGH